MDMTQVIYAQLAMMLIFALMPMLGMTQARRAQRVKIKFFMPGDDAADTRRDRSIRIGGSV